MLTEDMQFWHGLVIAVVSLILQACLLAVVNYLLSRHIDDSDTSSVSSNTSDSSHGPLPTGQATKNVNYTQVVFSATGRLKNESDLDYENIKETTDYVNIDPQSHTLDSWTSANPAVSEPVEYTQVAL
uniref:Regulator of hemoglobinization and erythroid cell expansion n=1 Tax=Rousettus aegyptiacus TaxID=9407 RepID=A0A7J8BG75_ROUAE|nr:regulator of hemoglobinization and erythroid cell expansion [Rousettus aegyptiacus]